MKSEELINSPNLSNLLAQNGKNQSRLKRLINKLTGLYLKPESVLLPWFIDKMDDDLLPQPGTAALVESKVAS